MKDSDKPKLIIAVVVLIVAGALLAWNFGLFSGGATTAPPPPTEAPKATGGPHSAPGAK
jgi:hypothetical protein